MPQTELRNVRSRTAPLRGHWLKSLAGSGSERAQPHPEARRVGLPPNAHDIKVLITMCFQGYATEISSRSHHKERETTLLGALLKQSDAHRETVRLGCWVKDEIMTPFPKLSGWLGAQKTTVPLTTKVVSLSVTRRFGSKAPVLTKCPDDLVSSRWDRVAGLSERSEQ